MPALFTAASKRARGIGADAEAAWRKSADGVRRQATYHGKTDEQRKQAREQAKKVQKQARKAPR